jgi:hypothetical protein
MRAVLGLLLVAVVACSAGAASASDDSIKQAIVQASIASYPSVCACPYSIMRNGRACGGRSAYSRPGGYAPICYPADVTPEMIRQYRVAHSQ